MRAQIYVDDPAMVIEGCKEEAISALTNILLWAGVLGFPLKLSKAQGGKAIRWIGAIIKLHDDSKRSGGDDPSRKEEETPRSR